MSEYEVELSALVYGGDAMGRLPDGRAVFVPFGLPQEQVKIRITSEKRGHAHAEIVEMISSSPDRIEARCPHFTACGGCHYQHLPYEKQLQYKEQIVKQQLSRIAGLSNSEELVEKIIPSPNEWTYRNTVQYHLHSDGRLGFQAVGDRGIIPIEKCYLLEEAIEQFSHVLDIESISGLERISIRLGDGDDLLLTLESNDELPPSFSVDMPLSAVYVSPEKSFLLSGDDYTVIQINDRPFKVSNDSFFQVNTKMAEQLVDVVLREADLSPKIKVLDLYCGVGLFSAFIADKVSQCVGIEMSGASALDFSDNLDEFDNIELYVGAAEETLPDLAYMPDLVIVDPPRAGLHRQVLDWLNGCDAQTILYISCDVATLARDLRRFIDGNYRVMKVIPFDFFPQTYHIENLVILKKK